MLFLLNKVLAIKGKDIRPLSSPRNILIIRQHNELGHLLASISLLRAVKEAYPECKLTLIAGSQNFHAITKNEFVDEYYTFGKFRVLMFNELGKFIKLIRRKYDAVFVPATVRISYTSILIARFVKADYKVGPASLSGEKNLLKNLLNVRIDLDWRKYPDAHVSDFVLDILRPFAINTKCYNSSLQLTEKDTNSVTKFISQLPKKGERFLIGIHVGARRSINRWSIRNYIRLIEKLNETYDADFYITGTSSDMTGIKFLKKNLQLKVGYFVDYKITKVAALIELSDLFISNDTGTMHIAGTTNTPQISIFGPSNPFNWAPLGRDKFFIKKSELIDSVTVDSVIELCDILLRPKESSNSRVQHTA